MTEVPDALGEAGRARLAARALLSLQVEQANLDIAQISNGHADSDPLVGPQGQPVENLDGSKVTYGERRARLNEAAVKLAASQEHCPEVFAAEVEKLRAQSAG